MPTLLQNAALSMAVATLLLGARCSARALAENPGGRAGRAVYGRDSRVDEAEATPTWRAIGRSTALLVGPSLVQGGRYAQCSTLGARYQCPSGLRFSDQITCGSCSGTLIAPDLIATYDTTSTLFFYSSHFVLLVLLQPENILGCC